MKASIDSFGRGLLFFNHKAYKLVDGWIASICLLTNR